MITIELNIDTIIRDVFKKQIIKFFLTLKNILVLIEGLDLNF